MVCGTCLANAADVLLVRQTVTQPTPRLDQEAVNGFLGRLSRRLDRAGIAAATVADREVTTEVLAAAKLVLLPYNPAVPASLAAALGTYVGQGGKLGLFYCSDARLLNLVGVSAATYRGGDDLPKLDGVSFAPTPVADIPLRLRQRSWNVVVPTLAERGGATVAGSWVRTDGEGPTIPAFTIHPRGFTFGHVYLDEEPPVGEQWLLAVVEHFVPGAWAEAIRQRLLAPLGFLECADLAALERRARACERPEALVECRRAIELRAQARALLEAKKYVEAQALAAQSSETAEKAYLRTVPARSGELRGAWIHSAFGIADWGWDRTIKALADHGFNAVFPNLCWGAVADYPSAVLPVHPDVATKGNQLQLCLDACRRYGVELHVWRVNWNMGHRTPAAIREQYVEAGRVQVTRKGEPSLFLAPHLEENVRLEREAMLEIVRTYPVAGIHFDYIRYPGEHCDFSDSARAAFTQWHGAAVTNWPADCAPGGALREAYNRWRRANISRLVREVSEGAHALRPEVRVSAAVFGGWEGARESIAQDTAEWIANGWLDFICPMNYTPSDTFLADLLGQQMAMLGARIPLYCGIGAWEHPSVARTAGQIDLARRLGADGFICFSLTERFATTVLPLLASGPSQGAAGPLLPHHSASRLQFGACEGDPDLEGAYPLRRRLTIEGRIPGKPFRFTPTVTVLRNGYSFAAGTALDTDLKADVIRCELRPREPGMYQIEVGGTFQARRTSAAQVLLARSTPVRVLSDDEAAAARRRTGPPQFAGTGGVKVAVWQQDTYGADPLLAALSGRKGVDAVPLFNLKPESLAECDVVILPQPRTLSRRVTAEATWEPVQEYARRGGVMVTHSLVGIRGFPTLFPEVATAGEPLLTSEWRLAGRTALGRGIAEGPQRSTFSDCISLKPGRAGSVVLEAGDGVPVAVLGRHGRGRFLACGLGLGIGPGDTDVDLGQAEAVFLANAVDWLAGQRRR
jgi:uncharacterized lipoprotein YddW (UPF0748 family)